MAVTPMDLQVLFMQESNAARKAEKQKKHGEKVRDNMARRTTYRSLRETVKGTDEASSKRVDEEGSQGTPNYFARREYSGRKEDENNKDKNRRKEEGKGTQMDFTA